jgi:hypothetical protein
VDIVTSYQSWNGEAQLPQAVQELPVIELKMFSEHIGVRILVQDDEVDVPLSGDRSGKRMW